ncbi:mandelate racemase [Edaphobacter acidisoli]|uniref:Mandelate racemase n=1 Tax=Edaphobacter acidisoli TaxID=2040573 RepID=A0A916RRB2_9BACT|nr:enolase C-terminal domain-like protein [Edaphobacter acidisoli]GGA67397.1 mandelate racemase [Edaphobacter acidisoli]
MPGSSAITRITAVDMRYPLPPGAGTDAVHTNPEYSLAVTHLETDDAQSATGITLTLGEGNRLVCNAIEILARPLLGRAIEDLMADFGSVSRQIANDSAMRWLGPHKGVVHLALASITNACFDLWAKARGVPLWRLLLELTPEELVGTLDLSYLEEVLPRQCAIDLIRSHQVSRAEREGILKSGYPGYDTSIGWMAYDDDKVRELTKRALARGFSAFKLKVGSADESRDIRRAHMLRECAGDSATLMFDANQQWNLPTAMRMCRDLAVLRPLWIEEPTHPDDLMAHVELASAIAPVKVAAGEHIPNRVVFKNFLRSGAMHYVQADATRLAGVSEFLTVSLLARRLGLPVVPHVGDMGQLHQHLVLFNHIALGHEVNFLEHIPHLRQHFVHPAQVEGGVYRTPQEPGASLDLVNLSVIVA